MSQDRAQSNSKVLERIAFVSVVVFALGLAYAIHITSKTVASIERNHYGDQVVNTAQIGPAQSEDGSSSTDGN